ncbi:hypothetical protein M8J76_008542 [Diaphorina citri]|nr:hypothetical protein M8J76_008542 [Diaphorina citri]
MEETSLEDVVSGDRSSDDVVNITSDSFYEDPFSNFSSTPTYAKSTPIYSIGPDYITQWLNTIDFCLLSPKAFKP